MFNHSSVVGGPGFLPRCLIGAESSAVPPAATRGRTETTPTPTPSPPTQAGALRALGGLWEEEEAGAQPLARTSHTKEHADDREAGYGERDPTIELASKGGKGGGRGGKCRPCSPGPTRKGNKRWAPLASG